MRKCNVYNDQEIPINVSVIQEICGRILASEQKKAMVNIVFVKLEKIAEYNKYRNVDGPTDVLSFSYNSSDLLGEIYICPQYVKENAKYFKVSFGEELVRVCVHGILHLLGYDHETNESDAKKMFEKQENYVRELSGFCDRIS